MQHRQNLDLKVIFSQRIINRLKFVDYESKPAEGEDNTRLYVIAEPSTASYFEFFIMFTNKNLVEMYAPLLDVPMWSLNYFFDPYSKKKSRFLASFSRFVKFKKNLDTLKSIVRFFNPSSVHILKVHTGSI